MPSCINIKQDLQDLKKILSNKTSSIGSKIDAIKEFHKKTNTDLFDKYLQSLESSYSLLNNRKKVSALIDNGKKVELDGQTYIYGPTDGKIKIYNLNTGEEIVELSKEPESYAKVLKAIDGALASKEYKTLSGRIINTIRKRFPVSEDGKIDARRTIFRTKGDDTLFNSTLNPFTDEGTKLLERLNNIINYIPKSIKDVIIGNDKKSKMQMRLDFGILADRMSVLKVPTEKVWNIHYELDENGNFVAKDTRYLSPNYLYLIGDIVEHENESSDKLVPKKYYELKLDPQIEEIVRFYSMKAIVDMAEMIEDFQFKKSEDIADELNVSTEKAIKMQELWFKQGIVPASYFMSNISKDMFKALDLSVSREASVEIQEGLAKSLDAMVRATLVENGLVHDINSKDNFYNEAVAIVDNMPNRVSSEERSEAIKSVMARLQGQYKITDTEQKLFKLNRDQFIVDDLDTFKNISRIVNKLQYAAPTHSRGLGTAIPSIPSKLMLKSDYKISKENYEFIKKQSAIKWKFKEDFHDFVKLYEDDNYAALKTLGYVSDFSKYHVSEIERLQSINDKIEREADLLVGMYKNSPDFVENGFYLEWGETKSGRPTIVSDINPQESKIHRTFIEQDGHRSELTKKDIEDNTDNLVMFKLAITQALDMDPDKNSIHTMLKKLDNLVKITIHDITVDTSTLLGSALHTAIYSKFGSDEYVDAMATIYNESEGNHGIQAVRTLRRMNEWFNGNMKEPFNNDLTIETDAITSGMMLTLTQILDSDAIDLLAKGGIYTDKTLKKWSDYTKYWLGLKYQKEGIDVKDIEFTASALIEAGIYHQDVKDAGENVADLLPDGFKPNKEFFYKDAEPAFHDLYKTLGTEMVENIGKAKESIEKQLSEDEKKIKNVEGGFKVFLSQEIALAKATLALLNSIGELTPSALRKIAKSPVMVYVYGASIGSIKNKLAHSVAKEQFIKDVKNINKLLAGGLTRSDLSTEDQVSLDKSTAYVNAMINMININDAPIKFKKYDENGKFHFLTIDELNKMSPYERLMYLDIDSSIVNLMQKITNATFGSAIEEAFKKVFPSVDKYRNRMKAAELLTFELFNARYSIELEDIKRKKKKLAKKDVSRLISKLFNEGYSHDILYNGKPNDEAQPLEKHKSVGDRSSASFVFKFDPNIERKDGESDEEFRKRLAQQHRYNSTLESLEQGVNSGAISTISIHKRDGMIIVKAIGDNPWLSIYDAIVQASHTPNVLESTSAYNKATIETMSHTDLIYDVYSKLSNMITNLQERLNSEDEKTKRQAFRELKFIQDRFKPVVERSVDIEYAENGEYTPRIDGEVSQQDDGKYIVTFDDKPEGAVNKRRLFRKTIKYNIQNGKVYVDEYYNNKKYEPEGLSKIVKTIAYDSGLVEVTEIHRRSHHYSIDENKNIDVAKPKYTNKLKTYIYTISYSYDNGFDPIIDAINGGEPFSVETHVLDIGEGKINLEPMDVENEKVYEKNYMHADVSKEIGYTGITLNVLLDLISDIEADRKNRFNNWNQLWHSNHSGMSNIGPVPYKVDIKKYKPLSILKIKQFATRLNNIYKNSSNKFIKEKIDSLLENNKNINQSELTSYKNLIEYANSNNKNIVLIGGQYSEKNIDMQIIDNAQTAQDAINGIFSLIGARNIKTYTKNDNVIIDWNGLKPFNRKGQITYNFKSLRAAIEAGSTITMIVPDFSKVNPNDKITMNLYRNAWNLISHIKESGYSVAEATIDGAKYYKFIQIKPDEKLGNSINEIQSKMIDFIRKAGNIKYGC